MSKKIKGDTACDLRFLVSFFCPKACGGHCLRLVIWGAYLHKTIKGDTACDLRFGMLNLSRNLRKTLLAICDLENLSI